MRKYVSHGKGLPNWSSPISHAVVVDNICYLSGQLSISEEGNYIEGTIREEATRAFDNMLCALRAAEFALGDLAFVDIALCDIKDIGAINELYASIFEEGRRPARTIYQVDALPFGGKVKVMGVAVKERSVG